MIENGDFGKECYNMIKDYKQQNWECVILKKNRIITLKIC